MKDPFVNLAIQQNRGSESLFQDNGSYCPRCAGSSNGAVNYWLLYKHSPFFNLKGIFFCFCKGLKTFFVPKSPSEKVSKFQKPGGVEYSKFRMMIGFNTDQIMLGMTDGYLSFLMDVKFRMRLIQSELQNQFCWSCAISKKNTVSVLMWRKKSELLANVEAWRERKMNSQVEKYRNAKRNLSQSWPSFLSSYTKGTFSHNQS